MPVRQRRQALEARVPGHLLLQTASVVGPYSLANSSSGTGSSQMSARLAATLEPQLIIDVLLVLVRHPGALPAEVARRLRHHSPPVSRVQVQAVFDRFELLEGGKKGGSGAR